MKTEKNDWKHIAKFWAASGAIKGYKRQSAHKEMRAFLTGLFQGLFIGIVVGVVLTLLFTVWR